MAVKNEHGLEVWVKPESEGQKIKKIGREGYPGRQDGIALPKKRPGEVFKSVDNIDIIVNSDGSVTLEPAVGLPDDIRETVEALISAAGQMYKGGWHDKPTDEMKRSKSWNELFNRAKPPKKKPANRRPPNTSGENTRRRGGGNRDWLNDARDRGLFSGGGGGGPIGVVTIRDLE